MTAMERIKQLGDEIRERYAEISAIRAECEHDWQPSYPADLDCSEPKCSKCGQEGHGWWCEKSPTKTCDYRQKDGRMWLDSCRYCGQPEERK